MIMCFSHQQLKCGICHVLLTVLNSAFISRQQTFYWIFYTDKTCKAASTDINLLGLDETSSVAYNLGENSNFRLFFLNYFSVAKTLAKSSHTSWCG